MSLVGVHGCSSDEGTPATGGKGGKAGKGSGGMSAGSSGKATSGGKAGMAQGGSSSPGGEGGNAPGGEASAGAGAGAGGASGDDAGGAPGTGGTGGTGGKGGKGGRSNVGEGGMGAGLGGEGGTPSCETIDPLPLLNAAPLTLDLTGLYTSSGAAPTDVAPYVQEFAPEYVLWSDGATKKRWVYLPPCTQIDTSDMDHWDFPVGARFWKEFVVPSAGVGGDTRVETRFIHRFGPGDTDWLFAAYQWEQDATTAGATAHVPDGVADANGTQHDIPNSGACNNCHGKLVERALGFSAFQLSHGSSASGVSMKSLSDDGLLTVPAPAGFHPPGDATTQAALGYLHANCGNCHNSSFTPISPPPLMRLLVAHDTPDETDTYTSLVGIPVAGAKFSGYDRVERGDHANSEIILRMSTRVLIDQMPPVGTEVVDAAGVQIVSNWIDSLPP